MTERLMKDSGIEWLGKIPNNWELKRLKAILVERNEKNDPIKTDNILSLGLNYGVIPYSEREIAGGNKAKDDLSQYKLAYPNDIVMNSMNVISGSVGISNYYGCVSPVYYMFYPRNNEIFINYYNMIFQSKAFQRSLLGLGNGIMMKENDEGNFNTVRMRIPLIKLNAVQLPVPSYEEQTRIADFLEKKVSQIDNVITKTKQSIEEYKKLKQSIITEAVTKGLNPDVEMKDSGIEWIGRIPVMWQVRKVKFFYKMQTGFTPDTKKTEYYDNDGFDWITISDLNGEATIPPMTKSHISNNYVEEYRPRISPKGSLLYSFKLSVGQTAFTDRDVYTNEAIVSFLPDNQVCLQFLKYSSYMIIENANDNIYGAKILNQDLINNAKIVFPPVELQKQIASYLDRQCSKYDELISKKEKIVEELEQYKKSLIYEYVTGKKEVA